VDEGRINAELSVALQSLGSALIFILEVLVNFFESGTRY